LFLKFTIVGEEGKQNIKMVDKIDYLLEYISSSEPLSSTIGIALTLAAQK
jgi:hypothetical protein